ncbi:putative auxin-induced protein 5NG4-like [Capsicum annuum]|nr:putative auxin-induced protein 5NG4-like [Capsicum annuum]KAF3658920.1 putative auxin-induced protein 5NG4-like [Capsicum annuum]
MNNSLTGIVPPSVENATKLLNFNLSGNSINGYIPKEISNLSQLLHLYLFNNQLTATAGLHLPNPERLCLALNDLLDGEVPLFIANASKLELLVLNNNFLTGTIPTNLGNLRALRELLDNETNEEKEVQRCGKGTRDQDSPLANVLLDEEMMAHVAVFGISKMLVVSKSITHTETLGSLGYIALDEIMSISCNVYSYGIMLREVLATKRPMDEEIFNKNLGLVWIRALHFINFVISYFRGFELA